MQALVQRCQLFDFSFSYDGLTLYPKSDLGEDAKISLALTACGELTFVYTPPNITEYGEHFISGYDTATKTALYDRAIYRDDDDHAYYHHDEFQMDNDHFHLKFNAMLTRDQLDAILTIFQEHELVSDEEKQAFLFAFDERYRVARETFNVCLTGFDVTADTNAIMQHIAQVSDNDILADLHAYLLFEKFDYLRKGNHYLRSANQNFLGEDRNHHIVNTTESWAMIEKGIALQMEKNVKDNVSFFSKPLSHERAAQLQQTHAFFAIKRKAVNRSGHDNGGVNGKHFQAFEDRNNDVFEKSYEKHFKKFG